MQQGPHGSASILTAKARMWQYSDGLAQAPYAVCAGELATTRAGLSQRCCRWVRASGCLPSPGGVGHPTSYKNDITLIDVRKRPHGRAYPWRERLAGMTLRRRAKASRSARAGAPTSNELAG